jgi:hypothetical protein
MQTWHNEDLRGTSATLHNPLHSFKNLALVYYRYFFHTKPQAKTIILTVVLYGCETWSLALREEHRLKVFENKVLRRILGPKRDEVTEGWRKLHNEELHDFYSSPSIIRIIKLRRMKWAEHVARMGEKRNAYRLLVGRPGGRRPLGRTRCRWVDNIKLDLLEIY